jgi:uncharacterized radical SAM superfamily Fe-S cluster-containing enzyme
MKSYIDEDIFRFVISSIFTAGNEQGTVGSYFACKSCNASTALSSETRFQKNRFTTADRVNLKQCFFHEIHRKHPSFSSHIICE